MLSADTSNPLATRVSIAAIAVGGVTDLVIADQGRPNTVSAEGPIHIERLAVNVVSAVGPNHVLAHLDYLRQSLPSNLL